MSDDCFERVRTLVADTLEVEHSEIDAESCADNLPAWDSLAHLMVLTAVERDFGLKLPRLESYTVKNVGELVSLVKRATSAASAPHRQGG